MKKASSWPAAPHDMAKMKADAELTAASKKVLELTGDHRRDAEDGRQYGEDDEVGLSLQSFRVLRRSVVNNGIQPQSTAVRRATLFTAHVTDWINSQPPTPCHSA